MIRQLWLCQASLIPGEGLRRNLPIPEPRASILMNDVDLHPFQNVFYGLLLYTSFTQALSFDLNVWKVNTFNISVLDFVG